MVGSIVKASAQYDKFPFSRLASSAKRGKSGKKGKTPEPEPEPAPEPPSTPLPVPGSDEWEFVDRDISDVSTRAFFYLSIQAKASFGE